MYSEEVHVVRLDFLSFLHEESHLNSKLVEVTLTEVLEHFLDLVGVLGEFHNVVEFIEVVNGFLNHLKFGLVSESGLAGGPSLLDLLNTSNKSNSNSDESLPVLLLV